MRVKLVRSLSVVAFLPILCIGVMPNPSFAQMPCMDVGAGNGNRSIFGLRQRSAPSIFPFLAVRQPLIESSPAPSDTSSDPILYIPADAEQATRTWDESILLDCEIDRPWRHRLRRFFCDGEWYFSWGFSRESWAPTNIHVSQPSQGNHFTVYDVRGSDDASWNSLFGSQYNFRIGRFVDEARTLAVEFSFDHTKYNTNDGQTARLAGTIAGKPIDANVVLTDPFFHYQLHNGANHVMINLVKRVPLIGQVNESFSVAAIGKVGLGVMVPHAENLILGKYNDVGGKTFGNVIGVHRGWWQLDGWTTGVEVGFRAVLWKPIYIELTDKVAFAQLGDVPVYQGTARHNLWMNEIILSIGFTYGGR